MMASRDMGGVRFKTTSRHKNVRMVIHKRRVTMLSIVLLVIFSATLKLAICYMRKPGYWFGA